MDKKQRIRITALVLTGVNFLIYLGLAAFVVYLFVSNSLYDAEAFTMLGLMVAVYVFLFIALLTKNDNLLLGVLVASLAYSLLSCVTTDFAGIKNLGTSFGIGWAYGLASVFSLLADIAFVVATLILFYELLSGTGDSCSKRTMIPFLCYLGLSVVALIFTFVYSAETNFQGFDVMPIINILGALNSIFVLYACFYKKEEED
jgi:hypothetical protein